MLLELFSVIALISENSNRDFYQILGLPHDCKNAAIKRAYMKLSKKYHPDKNKSAEEMYTNINDAYATLSNPLKRRIFDLYGEAGVHSYESPNQGNDPLYSLTVSTHPSQATEKIKKVGSDIHITFPAKLEDIFNGKLYPIHITRDNMCRCPTKGFYCKKCHGSATIQEDITRKLMIERGSEEGMTYFFEDSGDVTEENGPGHIYVHIVTKSHPIYTRFGSNLNATINITLQEALYGFKRSLPYLDGTEVVVEHNSSISDNEVITVEGKGLPEYLFPEMHGNLYIHPKIVWPDLTESQISKLEHTFENKM